MFHFRFTNLCSRAGLCFVLLNLVLSLTGASPSYAAASWDEAITIIDKLYDSSQYLEASHKAVKRQIQLLRKENNGRLQSLNTRIRMIDKSKLDRLQAEAEAARKKHAPLLASYTTLGKKAAEARKNKDSKNALLYDLKRNRIKAEAASARQVIKQKKDNYSAAKQQAAAKAKPVKAAIANVPGIKKQITAENQRIAAWNKRKTAANKRYKAAVKQGNAPVAGAELAAVVDTMKQIQTSLQSIIQYEQSIAAMLSYAEARLPN